MGRRSKQDWQTLIKDYRRSGETQKSFCKKRKISVHTLQYHLSRSPSQGAALVPVVPSGFIDITSPNQKSPVELELTLPSGAVLRVRG